MQGASAYSRGQRGFQCEKNWRITGGWPSPAWREQAGRMYLRGDGLALNNAEAFRLFQKSCCQGTQGARIKLACMYDEGFGMPKDPEAAHAWILSASHAARSERAGSDTFPRRLNSLTNKFHLLTNGSNPRNSKDHRNYRTRPLRRDAIGNGAQASPSSVSARIRRLPARLCRGTSDR